MQLSGHVLKWGIFKDPWYETAAGSAVVAGMCVLATMVWSLDSIVIYHVPQDYYFAWMAGAVWTEGHVPSIDFPSAFGPLYYLNQGLGFWAADGRADTVPKATVIAFLLTLPMMLLVLVPRFSFLVTSLCLLFFGLCMMSPRPEDLGIPDTAFFANYNRYGFVWTSLAIIAAAVPWRKSGEWTVPLDGLAIGLLLFSAAYTKATFAVYAGFAVALLFVYRYRLDIKALAVQAAWTGLPVVAGAGLIEILIGGYHVAYISDLLYTASIQTTNLFIHRMLIFDNYSAYFYFADLYMYALFLFVVYRTYGQETFLKVLAFTLFVAAALFMAGSQVHADYSPILSVAGIVSIGLLMNAKGMQTARARGIYSSANAIRMGFVAVLMVTAIEAGAVMWTHKEAGRSAGAGDLYELGPSLGFYFPKDRFWAKKVWNAYSDVDDLIDRAGASRDGVICLGFSNGCPLFIGGRPPKGPLPWWDPGRSFGIDNPPPAERTFEDVNTILVSKIDRPFYSAVVFRTYADYIRENYTQAAESDYWVLWRVKEAE